MGLLCLRLRGGCWNEAARCLHRFLKKNALGTHSYTHPFARSLSTRWATTRCCTGPQPSLTHAPRPSYPTSSRHSSASQQGTHTTQGSSSSSAASSCFSRTPQPQPAGEVVGGRLPRCCWQACVCWGSSWAGRGRRTTTKFWYVLGSCGGRKGGRPRGGREEGDGAHECTSVFCSVAVLYRSYGCWALGVGHRVEFSGRAWVCVAPPDRKPRSCLVPHPPTSIPTRGFMNDAYCAVV